MVWNSQVQVFGKRKTWQEVVVVERWGVVKSLNI
jgi:hypothetical protein